MILPTVRKVWENPVRYLVTFTPFGTPRREQAILDNCMLGLVEVVESHPPGALVLFCLTHKLADCECVLEARAFRTGASIEEDDCA